MKLTKKWYFVIPEVTFCTKRAVAVENINRKPPPDFSLQCITSAQTHRVTVRFTAI